MNGEISLLIRSEHDILTAREKGRWLAEQVGFRAPDSTLVSTLVSDLTRMLLSTTTAGRILMRSVQYGNKKGIAIVVSDAAPTHRRSIARGIASSVGRSRTSAIDKLARRQVADEIEIRSSGHNRSIIRVIKWL